MDRQCMKHSKLLFLLSLLLFLGSVIPAYAVPIGLTLAADKDLTSLSVSDSVTFTVGITPSVVITGYTLDIQYDTSELTYVSATQLVPYFGSAFTPSFSSGLDPGTTGWPDNAVPGSGLATSDRGRASMLQVSDFEGVGDLFSLTFMVNSVVSDALADVTVGLLSTAADDISPGLSGSSFTISPGIVTASIGAVPEPASLLLIGTGLVGLVGISRRRR